MLLCTSWPIREKIIQLCWFNLLIAHTFNSHSASDSHTEKMLGVVEMEGKFTRHVTELVFLNLFVFPVFSSFRDFRLLTPR